PTDESTTAPTGEPCVEAAIKDFDAKVECVCPESLQGGGSANSTCVGCAMHCTSCTIKISNVQLDGSSPFEYRYSYKKQNASWVSSTWTSSSEYQFSGLQSCKNEDYTIRVEVRNKCTSQLNFEKNIVLPGKKCCCSFVLTSTSQHPLTASWKQTGKTWKVELDGWVDGNVCTDRIKVTAYLYKGSAYQNKKATKSANGRNFSIEDLRIDSGVTGSTPPAGNYRVKIVLENLNRTNCPPKEYWVAISSSS
nr:hypothetical protein [Candidatus Calescibacterium sp.]